MPNPSHVVVLDAVSAGAEKGLVSDVILVRVPTACHIRGGFRTGLLSVSVPPVICLRTLDAGDFETHISNSINRSVVR